MQGTTKFEGDMPSAPEVGAIVPAVVRELATHAEPAADGALLGADNPADSTNSSVGRADGGQGYSSQGVGSVQTSASHRSADSRKNADLQLVHSQAKSDRLVEGKHSINVDDNATQALRETIEKTRLAVGEPANLIATVRAMSELFYTARDGLATIGNIPGAVAYLADPPCNWHDSKKAVQTQTPSVSSATSSGKTPALAPPPTNLLAPNAAMVQWVWFMEGQWEEVSGKGNCTSPRIRQTVTLTGPKRAKKPLCTEIKQCPAQVIPGTDASPGKMITGYLGETNKTTTDSKTTLNFLNAILGHHGFGRKLEVLEYVVQHIEMNKRHNNMALYAKMAWNALCLQLAAELGMKIDWRTMFTDDSDIRDRLTIIYIGLTDPGAQADAIDKMQKAMGDGSFIFRVNRHLTPKELDLLWAIMLDPMPIWDVSDNNFILYPTYRKWPAFKNFGFVAFDSDEYTAAIVKETDPESIWALMQKIAVLRGELDDCIEGYYLACQLMWTRSTLDTLPDKGGWKFTDALLQYDIIEIPMPLSMSWVLVWASGQVPPRRVHASEFEELTALVGDDYFRTAFRIGELLNCAVGTVLKEYSVDDRTLQELHGEQAGVNEAAMGNTNPYFRGFARDLGFMRPILGRNVRPRFILGVAVAMRVLFNAKWPILAWQGRYWNGAGWGRRATRTWTPGTITGDPDLIPSVVDPICSINLILPGQIPRNWGWLGPNISVGWQHEVEMSSGARRGFCWFRGLNLTDNDLRTVEACSNHAYSQRCTNAVALWHGATPTATTWVAHATIGATVDWEHVGGLALRHTYQDSMLQKIMEGRSYDWRSSRVEAYAVNGPESLMQRRVQFYQEQHGIEHVNWSVSRPSYCPMDAPVLRLPALLGSMWADASGEAEAAVEAITTDEN